MCGIIGAIGNFETSKFKKTLDILKHRGPDSQFVYRHKNVLLGHARLAILDLDERSNQPMEFGDFVIVFNGEIYNYIEIKDELVKKGYKFYTDSDTEVILRSYEEWGKTSVGKFNGMWAFAILDKKNDTLFLSRDRLGVKPLYYIRDEYKFVFASEIKALVPYLDKVLANKDELVRYMIYGAQEHKKETMFKGIYRFLASHNALFDTNSHKLTFEPYFNFEASDKENISKKKAKDDLTKLVHSSINLRLRSDVKIGMALSGGVDSNVIVSCVHEKNKTIESFSSIYEDNDQENENLNIEKTVKKLKLKQHYIRSDIKGLIEDIKHIVYMQDEPFDTLGIFAQYKVYEKMKEYEVKVSLDGQGADEIFAGYPTYRAVMMRSNFFKLYFWIDYLKYNKNFIFQDLKMSMASFFPKIFEKLYFYKRAKKVFKKDISFLPGNKKMFSGFSNLNERLLNDTKEYLSVLLRYVDRNAMSKSIESRGPFLDYRMVDFALKMPARIKYKKGYSKYILRSAFSSIVEEDIIWNREKKGFPVPQSSWCNSKEFIDLASKHLVKSNLLKELNVNLNVKRSDPMYWKIVNIAIWEEVFNVKI